MIFNTNELILDKIRINKASLDILIEIKNLSNIDKIDFSNSILMDNISNQ